MPDTMLGIHDLSKVFSQEGQRVHAVRGFTANIHRGECLAIVGESGSGKSTIANMILGVHRPSGGQMLLDGEALPNRRALRHRRMIQLVQQNPLSSLNPRRAVGASLRLALDVHRIGDRAGRAGRVAGLLKEVGLPEHYASRYPAALSGGERQRVAIARALACRSELVVLDEPTSALDVIVQARILRLLDDLRAARGLTYVFITHDLAVVCNIADRVAVLRDGQLLELRETGAVFANPDHPYTRSLIAASPVITPDEIVLREKMREKGAAC